MNTLVLSFATIVLSFSNQAEIEPNHTGEQKKPQNLESIEPNLTLMQGYDRYLSEPNFMLNVERDA